MKSKTKTMYMHTLNGKPASYNSRYGGYLHFAVPGMATLHPDLRTIRKQQAHDRAESAASEIEYGYVKVKVPVPDFALTDVETASIKSALEGIQKARVQGANYVISASEKKAAVLAMRKLLEIAGVE